ncbi:very long chain fatty acid elongase AAEL008004-like isoform X1 [Temnothorax longispinosus]|uniref:very long chain fatty acid elongase AAEL008004-like isoform X1 n=2 Tax=Temnothorax longispinosus TaxID=300112 RepID=UPI003A99B063
MASLIQLISNYNEVLRNVRDPVVDTWFLMESPGPMLCIVSAYLIFVLKVGPKIMKKRPAFQLNTVLILYNAFQVLFSTIWLTGLILNVDIKYLFPAYGYDTQDYILPPENVRIAMLQYAWWYFFAKIIELLDTVFFVLRKKQNQITFLHVYHHTIVVVVSWCYLKFLPGEQGVILGFLNSLVHVIMYSYYFIAALGPKYKKYLWWKKYMTWIQLLQFVLMLIHLILTLIMDCRTPKALTYLCVIITISFMYLFNNFYRQAYKKKISSN